MSTLVKRSPDWYRKALIQGTQEWLDLRNEMITASDAPSIMGQSPWTTSLELWERKMGFRPEQEETASMREGKFLEEEARQRFIEKTGIHVEPAVVFHPFYDWMMSSLDGHNAKKRVILEIKTTKNVRDHEDVKRGIVPTKYYAQLQHQIETVKYDGAYYLSYCKGEEVIIEVDRDELYIEAMLEEEEKFLFCMRNFIPPM